MPHDFGRFPFDKIIQFDSVRITSGGEWNNVRLTAIPNREDKLVRYYQFFGLILFAELLRFSVECFSSRQSNSLRDFLKPIPEIAVPFWSYEKRHGSYGHLFTIAYCQKTTLKTQVLSRPLEAQPFTLLETQKKIPILTSRLVWCSHGFQCSRELSTV